MHPGNSLDMNVALSAHIAIVIFGVIVAEWCKLRTGKVYLRKLKSHLFSATTLHRTKMIKAENRWLSYRRRNMVNVPKIDMAETGINIANLRKQKNISVKALQKMLGFNTPQAIFKWQRGDSLPTLDNLVILAEIFGVKIDDIVVLTHVTN